MKLILWVELNWMLSYNVLNSRGVALMVQPLSFSTMMCKFVDSAFEKSNVAISRLEGPCSFYAG